jgi:hypothetical protein
MPPQRWHRSANVDRRRRYAAFFRACGSNVSWCLYAVAARYGSPPVSSRASRRLFRRGEDRLRLLCCAARARCAVGDRDLRHEYLESEAGRIGHNSLEAGRCLIRTGVSEAERDDRLIDRALDLIACLGGQRPHLRTAGQPLGTQFEA